MPGAEKDCLKNRKLGSGKPAAFFLHTYYDIPTNRGDKPEAGVSSRVFRITLFEKIFRPGNTYRISCCVNAV
jgi:hypothetical protein